MFQHHFQAFFFDPFRDLCPDCCCFFLFFFNLFLCRLHAGGKDGDSVESPGPAAEDDSSRQLRYVSGQYFFEYLVVVSLQKAKGSSSYEPQITYQFPKVGQWGSVLSNRRLVLRKRRDLEY